MTDSRVVSSSSSSTGAINERRATYSEWAVTGLRRWCC